MGELFCKHYRSSMPVLEVTYRISAMGIFLRTVSALLVILLEIAAVVAQASEPLQIRISCGSLKDVQTSGFDWLKDFGYSGGNSANISSDAAVEFTTLRYFQISDGPENCYNISVPSGHYSFRFYFSYGQTDNGGQEPLFDVSIEGTLAYSLKPGWSKTDDTSYADSLVFVDDNAATACFHSTGHGNPSVVSFEILQLYDDAYDLGGGDKHDILLDAVKRISCGTEINAYGINLGAHAWGGDRYWSGDSNSYQGSNVSMLNTFEPIRNANIRPNFYPEELYQGARISRNSATLTFTFQIESSQNYSIWLHFAEISRDVTMTRQRVFDVLVNDQKLFEEVDIFSAAGGAFAAVFLNKTVLVDGRTLIITFKPVIGDILVNGIEIYKVSGTEARTVSQQAWVLDALKPTLGVPTRLGWNGDPCVPQEHPWSGIACQYNDTQDAWFVHGLELGSQGLRGTISEEIVFLSTLQAINFSGNSLQGGIPAVMGNLSNLESLDLSNNNLNGSIPETLGALTQLRQLYLNDNQLSGKVPSVLAAGPIHGASFNFLGNPGLCGIPGLQACNKLSAGAKAGIVIGSLLGTVILVALGVFVWQRRNHIARIHKILSPKDAPYAKSRTSAVKDAYIQLSRFGSFTEQRLIPTPAGP